MIVRTISYNSVPGPTGICESHPFCSSNPRQGISLVVVDVLQIGLLPSVSGRLRLKRVGYSVFIYLARRYIIGIVNPDMLLSSFHNAFDNITIPPSSYETRLVGFTKMHPVLGKIRTFDNRDNVIML